MPPKNFKFDIEKIPPEELGLTKEGRITDVDLAQTMAEAGKVFREMAQQPGLSEEEKNRLLELAEKSEEEAYQKWLKEHQEELLKKFEEKMKLLQRTRVADPQVAEEMARTFYPYLLASEMKDINEDDRKKILEEGEKVVENKFQIIAPKRIEELDKKVDELRKEIERKTKEYDRIYSELKLPLRGDYTTQPDSTIYLVPKRFDESKEKISYSKWEERVFKEGERVCSEFASEEEVGSFVENIKKLEEDYRELLPQFQDLVKKEEELIRPLEDECKKLKEKKGSLKKGLFESKYKFQQKTWDLEEKIDKKSEEIRYHQRKIENYKELTIERIEKFFKNIPPLLDLLSQIKTLQSQEKEIVEIRNNLFWRLEEIKKGREELTQTNEI